MKKELIAISCLVFLLAGCSDYPRDSQIKVETHYFGKILGSHVIPTSFNETMKMSIETEKGTFILSGVRSVPKGVEAKVYVMKNGDEWLSWEGSTYRFY